MDAVDAKPALNEQRKRSSMRREDSEVTNYLRSRPSSSAAVYKSEVVEQDTYDDDCDSEDGTRSPLQKLSLHSAPTNSRPLSRYANKESPVGEEGKNTVRSSSQEVPLGGENPVAKNRASSSQLGNVLSPLSGTLRDYARPESKAGNPSGAFKVLIPKIQL